jgi:hypothetical protein
MWTQVPIQGLDGCTKTVEAVWERPEGIGNPGQIKRCAITVIVPCTPYELSRWSIYLGLIYVGILGHTSGCQLKYWDRNRVYEGVHICRVSVSMLDAAYTEAAQISYDISNFTL